MRPPCLLCLAAAEWTECTKSPKSLLQGLEILGSCLPRAFLSKGVGGMGSFSYWVGSGLDADSDFSGLLF